jgi:hypothetical protein
MDPARIAALRDVRDRDAPLNRMLRASLIRIGSLRPAGKRPARGADGRIYRGSKNRSHVVTPLGLAALATAHRIDAERIAHPELVALPPAPNATAAVIDAMLDPYTKINLDDPERGAVLP